MGLFAGRSVIVFICKTFSVWEVEVVDIYFKMFCFVCMNVLSAVCMYIHHMCAVSEKARSCWNSWNWSYSWLWNTVSEPIPSSLQEKPVLLINYCAISPAPRILETMGHDSNRISNALRKCSFSVCAAFFKIRNILYSLWNQRDILYKFSQKLTN